MDRREGRIKTHGHIAAADVETDAGNADLLLIGDDAADRLCIAKVAVRANDAGHDIADRHTVPHLGDGCLVMLAEHF